MSSFLSKDVEIIMEFVTIEETNGNFEQFIDFTE